MDGLNSDRSMPDDPGMNRVKLERAFRAAENSSRAKHRPRKDVEEPEMAIGSFDCCSHGVRRDVPISEHDCREAEAEKRRAAGKPVW